MFTDDRVRSGCCCRNWFRKIHVFGEVVEGFHKYGENKRASASRNFLGIERLSTSARVTSRAAEIFWVMIFSISCANVRPYASTFNSKFRRRLRASQLAEPNETQWPSTIISLEWSNGGGVSQTWQPRSSTCHHIARDAQCMGGRLLFVGRMMSTRTPRSEARLSAVTSALSGRKYGVRIFTDVCASASAASSVQRAFSKSASGPSRSEEHT